MQVAAQYEARPQRDCVTPPDLRSVKRIAKELPEFPEPTLRDLIYHSEERLSANGDTIPANGFADCIIRIGGRLWIDWPRFLAWIESHRGVRRTRRAA